MAEVRPRRWRWRPRGVPRYVAAPVEPSAAPDALEAAGAAGRPRREPGLVAVTIARILLAVHFGLPGGRSRRRRR
jgi:hypothetical protein